MAFDFDKRNTEKRTSSGFKDYPGHRPHTGFQTSSRRSLPSRRPGAPVPRPRRAGAQIPWDLILKIACVILVIAAIWIFRDAITAFLMQILTWVLTVVIIIAIVKLFIFPRR